MKRYLYRVQIVAYPKGATEPHPYIPEWTRLNPSWEPPGWDPDPEWIERFGRNTGGAFFWPKTDREFKSRSSARRLKNLIESYGATAVIQRSAEIVWPADGQEYVR